MQTMPPYSLTTPGLTFKQPLAVVPVYASVTLRRGSSVETERQHFTGPPSSMFMINTWI